MTKIEITTNELAAIIFGVPAAKCAPDGDAVKVFTAGYFVGELGEIVNTSVGAGYYYRDASAPNGIGWPARVMTGSEKVALTVDGGYVVSMEAESFVKDIFGQPGASVTFGARMAQRVASALS